ncbi:MAG: AtpZ/AtpI family protein [Patescibacteria group bacterium]
MINNYFEIDKQGNLKKTNQNFDKKAKAKKDFFSEYINVGYSLVTPILIGVIIGLAVDNKFHTKPYFTVFFIFFGMVSSFYNLYKMIKQDAKY